MRLVISFSVRSETSSPLFEASRAHSERGTELSLLGGPLLVATAMAAALMPVVTVLVWDHMHGPAWARVGQRGAIVLTAQMMALVFGFVALNDYGQFFTTWAELLGTTSTPKVIATRHSVKRST